MNDDNIISARKIEFADLPPDYDREMFDRWALACLIKGVLIPYQDFAALCQERQQGRDAAHPKTPTTVDSERKD